MPAIPARLIETILVSRSSKASAFPPCGAQLLPPIAPVLAGYSRSIRQGVSSGVAFSAVVLLAGWILAAPASSAEIATIIAGLQVTVWSNPAPSASPAAVIVFSHGFHGCATQSRFIMDAFANAGYIVFAPNHADATCDGNAQWSEPAEVPFKHPASWTDATYIDRHDDIARLLGALSTDPRYARRVDLTRIGLVGHSLGGYTVMGLAGAWASWKIPEVKAVLALSPYSQPFIVHGTLGGMNVPVMYQGGTRDPGTTPAVDKNGGAYGESLPPKVFVEFGGATHFAWTNIGVVAHASIVAYSVAFMNHYVLGTPPDPLLTRALPDVAVLKFQY